MQGIILGVSLVHTYNTQEASWEANPLGPVVLVSVMRLSESPVHASLLPSAAKQTASLVSP